MSTLKNTFYEDQDANVSIVEAVPCIKVKLSGFPRGSEHYQFVQSKLLETVRDQIKKYCRLHLLTDTTEAGLVLDEDMLYYKMNIIPAMEEAGIRYHAIVLPQKFIACWIKKQTAVTLRKFKVEYFESVFDAVRWLKKR